jgi:hypothetical protein
MEFCIKKPKFSYLHKENRVYIIEKKHPIYPLCEGKREYFTVPVLLKHYTSYRNTLIGYTKQLYVKPIMQTLLDDKFKVHASIVTCQDAISLSEMLAMPVMIIIEDKGKPHEEENYLVFYKPRRILN